MSCGCSNLGEDGKLVVDLVRSKGFADRPLNVAHQIECSCGKTFTMNKLVDKCPHCNMTYGVTPCSQSKVEKIKPAGIDY